MQSNIMGPLSIDMSQNNLPYIRHKGVEKKGKRLSVAQERRKREENLSVGSEAEKEKNSPLSGGKPFKKKKNESGKKRGTLLCTSHFSKRKKFVSAKRHHAQSNDTKR